MNFEMWGDSKNSVKINLFENQEKEREDTKLGGNFSGNQNSKNRPIIMGADYKCLTTPVGK